MMTCKPPLVAVATANGRRRPHDAVSPLQWWREDHSRRFAADVARLRQTLSSVALLGEQDWSAAVRGDPPAAVRAALRVGSGCAGPPDWRLDCAGSAVLLCAIAGNAAAATALAHLRRRFCRPQAGRTRGA
jgi:hypothetical protein